MTGIQAGELRILPANHDSSDFCSFKAKGSTLSALAKYPKVSLSFGTSVIFANITALPSKVPFNKLLVPVDILRRLSIPENKEVKVLVRENKIVFGPLIGIFVSGWETENLSQGICKNQYFYRYIKACEELNAICCFFSLNDICWERRLIKGWMLESDAASEGRWVSRMLPIPTAIYDRCFGSRGKEDGYELRSHLLNIPEVTVFNAMPKLKKRETFDLLQTHPDIKVCLPVTLPYLGPKGLARVLNTFDRVYLKPDGLSKGSGIFRVSRRSGGYTIEHRGPKANEVSRVVNLKGLGKLMEPYLERGGGYLIQAQIPLARYKGRQFDMRVLCQKDIAGKWIIGGIAVRVASPRSIITSPRSGGSVITWPHALKTVFKQEADQPGGIASKVTDIAFKVCRLIEERYGCCGELGLDMGIDANGKVWIIEVNAKPLKVSLKRLGDPELTQQVHANPIRFAYSLACKPFSGVK